MGFLNDLFYGRSYIAAPAEFQFLFCLMKNPLLYRSAWPESSREASERFLMETRLTCLRMPVSPSSSHFLKRLLRGISQTLRCVG